MRILVWQELFWPNIGGIEVLSVKLLEALARRGRRFVVVTRRDTPDLPAKSEYGDIEIYRYPLWNAFTGDHGVLMRTISELAELRRSFQPHLIHMNGAGPTSFVCFATRKATPLLATLHTMAVAARNATGADSLYGQILRQSNWISCVSEAVLAEARAFAPDVSCRSSVIYNGFDAPADPPSPLPYSPPQVLCLARLCPDKGVDLALETFARIVRRRPDVGLIIAGDGPLRASLEVQSRELGLTDSVQFLGAVAPNAVPKLLNSATLLLIPSGREGLPSVAIEAALMQRPVVATNVGGVPEVVVNKETGLLVQERNPEDLAAAVLTLLADPGAAVRYGLQARRRAQDLFSFAHYVDAYDALYSRIASA